MEWKSISNSAASKMQSFVSVVNSDTYEKFIDQDPQKHKILIFTERKTTSPLFKSLSKTFKDKLTFGEVKKGSETALFEKFKITETPALLAVTDPINHTGELFENLAEMKID